MHHKLPTLGAWRVADKEAEHARRRWMAAIDRNEEEVRRLLTDLKAKSARAHDLFAAAMREVERQAAANHYRHVDTALPQRANAQPERKEESVAGTSPSSGSGPNDPKPSGT